MLLLMVWKCVQWQAAHSKRVRMTLGQHSENEAQLNGVVELMLDITESSVAFCGELGAGKLGSANLLLCIWHADTCPVLMYTQYRENLKADMTGNTTSLMDAVCCCAHRCIFVCS